MMKKMILFLTIFVIVASCGKEEGPTPKEETVASTPVTPTATDPTDVSYSTDIAPIVTTKCATSSSCHNSASGGRNYTNYALLKVVADNGKLNSEVVVNKSMPVSGPLSDAQIALFKVWITEGALNN